MDFFKDMKNGKQYANISCTMEVYAYLMDSNFFLEKDFRLNTIKQKNELHSESEVLRDLYKKQRKLNDQIRIEEQKLNHNK